MRIHRTAALVALVALPIDSVALEKTDAGELHALEARLSAALVEQDVETLAELWHDDLVFIGTNGRTSTKLERLAAQRPTTVPPGQSNINDEVTVRLIGDIAVVTVLSRWTAHTDSGPDGNSLSRIARVDTRTRCVAIACCASRRHEGVRSWWAVSCFRRYCRGWRLKKYDIAKTERRS